jgi:gliding motility-associated-like protein
MYKSKRYLFVFLIFSWYHVSSQTDDCSLAPVLLVFEECILSPGSTLDLSQTSINNACGGNTDDDGWFKFQAKSELSSIQVFSNQASNMAIGIYTECINEIECIDGNNLGGTEILDVATEIGMTYYIQVYDVREGFGEFSICVVSLLQSPMSDCTGATIICEDSQIDFTPIGSGIDDFANPQNHQDCLLDKESQSAWYYFEILADAPPNLILSFILTPESSPDYDFALFGPNVICDQLGYPVRCSWASAQCANCPGTGLVEGARDASEGADGDGYLAPLIVQPGENYYLLIDNYFDNATGFNLTWEGTAAPFLNCNAIPPCGLIAEAGLSEYSCSDTLFQLNGSTAGASTNAKYTWNGTIEDIAFINDTNIPNPIVSVPSDYEGILTYTLTVSEGGCEDIDVLTVTRRCFTSESEQCPEQIVAHVTTNAPQCNDPSSGIIEIGRIVGGTPPYLYQLESGNIQSLPHFTGLMAGEYKVTIIDGYDCSAVVPVIISSSLGPTFDLGPDQSIIQGQEVVLTANTNIPDKEIKDIVWTGIEVNNCSAPCLNIIITPLSTTTVFASLVTLDNCMRLDEVEIFVEPKIDIYIPSVFSPNNDQVNDMFFISSGLGVNTIRDFRIYDRWGSLVFENNNLPTNQAQFGWNGKIKDRMVKSGIYIYIVNLVMPDQSIKTMSGDLTVISN